MHALRVFLTVEHERSPTTQTTRRTGRLFRVVAFGFHCGRLEAVVW
jgi:hypothetical protein